MERGEWGEAVEMGGGEWEEETVASTVEERGCSRARAAAVS